MYYDDQTILYYNGNYVRASATCGNLYSQTLHYGYGVFEGLRSYRTERGETRVFKAEAHYERLQESCRLLGIPFHYTVSELIDITYKVLAENGFSDAYIRPLVVCAPNMSLVNGQPSTLLIAAWEWGAYLGDKRLRLKISPYCRPHARSIHITAKAAGHYVNSILATSDAKKDGFDEALLLDTAGYLAEGPGANLFFEKNGELFTPAQGNILPGITRQTVLEICKAQGIPVHEGQYTPSEIKQADSAFYCGTGAEIVGIQQVDDWHLPLPWEKSIGATVQQAYLGLVREKDNAGRPTHVSALMYS